MKAYRTSPPGSCPGPPANFAAFARRAAFIAVVALAALSAKAQEQVTFGVGVSFNPTSAPGDNNSRFHSDGVADFYVLMHVGEYFRAELQFGFFSPTTQQTDSDSSGTFTERISGSVLRSTLGAFYAWHPDSTFTLYAGPRVGVLSSVEYRAYSRPSSGLVGGKTHWGAFVAAACFGGEYALSRHFTLGTELQLNSTAYGVPFDVPSTGTYPRDHQEQVYSTGAVVFARFFF